VSLTLQTFTSFDHLTVADIATLNNWTGSATSIVGGYDGGPGAVRGPSALTDPVTASTYAGLAVFTRFRPSSLAAEQLIMAIRTGSTDHVGLWLTTEGYLKLATGAGSSDGPWTSAAHDPLLVDTWYGLELGIYVDDQAGTTKVLLDGLSVSDLENTSVDTNGHASSFLPDSIVLSNASADFDDYVSSVGTSAPGASDYRSDLAGNPRIATLWPILSGNYTAWTPSAAVDHYTLIDDIHADTTATQLSTSTGNARESWRIQALPTDLSSIACVDATLQCRNETSNEQIRWFWRIGGTDYSGAASTMEAAGAWAFKSQRYATSPATSSAWTAAELEAAEMGAQRVSPPNPDGVVISQAVAVVLYDASLSNALTVSPSYPIPAWITRRAVVTDASTGYVARRQTQSSVSRQSGQQAVRSWQIVWNWLSPTEKASISAMFDAAIGRSFAIQVQPSPTSGYVSVYIMDDTLTMQNVSGQWWRASISVEEVI